MTWEFVIVKICRISDRASSSAADAPSQLNEKGVGWFFHTISLSQHQCSDSITVHSLYIPIPTYFKQSRVELTVISDLSSYKICSHIIKENASDYTECIFHLQPRFWVVWLEIKESYIVQSCRCSVQFHWMKFEIQKFDNEGGIAIWSFDLWSYSCVTWPEIEK